MLQNINALLYKVDTQTVKSVSRRPEVGGLFSNREHGFIAVFKMNVTEFWQRVALFIPCFRHTEGQKRGS